MDDWVQVIFGSLMDVLRSIQQSLDPMGLAYTGAQLLPDNLPIANQQAIVLIFDGMSQSANLFLDYLSALDYFINLPFFLFVVTIISVLEATLSVPRLFRFIRSMLW